MREREYEVKTYKVHAMCDKLMCDGEMKHEGRALMSNPPQYPHICTECGNTENLREVYPRITYMFGGHG